MIYFSELFFVERTSFNHIYVLTVAAVLIVHIFVEDAINKAVACRKCGLTEDELL